MVARSLLEVSDKVMSGSNDNMFAIVISSRQYSKTGEGMLYAEQLVQVFGSIVF